MRRLYKNRLFTAASSLFLIGSLISQSARAEENRELLWTAPSDRITASEAKKAPFYMTVPKSHWLGGDDIAGPQRVRNQSGYTFRDFEIDRLTLSGNEMLPEAISKNLGLRLFIFKRSQRAFSAEALAKTGMIKTGDILLTYRPEWRSSVAYSHLQLGISHASAVIISTLPNGKKSVVTVEMPFSYSGNLTSDHHYSDANALFTLHILRPNLTEQQRSNLQKWGETLIRQQRAAPSAFNVALTFNSAYSEPSYNPTLPYVEQQYGFIFSLARLAQFDFRARPQGNENLRSKMFCSEFAYSFLALRDCDPTQVQDGEISSCMKPYFPPQRLIGESPTQAGLGDGPNLILKAAIAASGGSFNRDLAYSPQGRSLRLQALTTKALVNGGPIERMSSGHQEMARSTAPMVGAVRSFYEQVLNPGVPAAAEFGGASGFNAQIEANGLKRNYAPASFMIEALKEEKTAERIDYVGTILYR